MNGLLTLENVSTKKIQEIIDLAIAFKNGKKKSFPNVKMANLFFENSTRTLYSFHMAMLNLGITPIDFNTDCSSVKKGETLYDTCKTFECLGVDGLVIRHGDDKYYNQLENIGVPIFNGGDGKSNHPSQTLLDLMTIYENFGKFQGLKICLMGDIKHSRVAHGNAEVMKRLGMEVFICCPPDFADDTAKSISIDTALETCDIINLLRVQFERHEHHETMNASSFHKDFGMTTERVAKMKDNAIIMHPAPVNRGIEIADDVVECEKSRILAQMTNGVFTRMAIITMVLEGNL